MVRTNIAVDDAVAAGLSQDAMRRNKTLYAFANECLAAMTKVCEEGGEPGQVYPSWKFERLLKDVDAVPLPGDLVEAMVKKLYDVQKEWLLKAWFDQGARLGSYLQLGYPKLEDVSEAVRDFEALLPLKRIEVRRADGDGKRKLKLTAVGIGLSTESTECALHLFRGLVSSYSGTVLSSRSSEGILELDVSYPHKQ